jgi:hypothetical protein
MKNNNLLVIIILVFILGYMVNSMCGGRLVEGAVVECNSSQPRNQGWGIMSTDDFGNKECVKCYENYGMGVHPGTGECVACRDDNQGLDTNYNCITYNADDYFQAKYSGDGGTGDYYYKQSKQTTGEGCSQDGWGEDNAFSFFGDSTCSEGTYCMKNVTELSKRKSAQTCQCFDISSSQANSGFLAESSYFGQYGYRAPPERYIMCANSQ